MRTEDGKSFDEEAEDSIHMLGWMFILLSLMLSIIFLLILGNVFANILFEIFSYIFYGGIVW